MKESQKRELMLRGENLFQVTIKLSNSNSTIFHLVEMHNL